MGSGPYYELTRHKRYWSRAQVYLAYIIIDCLDSEIAHLQCKFL